MTSVARSPYTEEQIIAWLRGLLTVAWIDGDFDPEEQEMIAQLIQELAPSADSVPFRSITPEELAAALGRDRETAENFLRTAVMVAVADGTYSSPEAELLRQFSQAFGVEVAALKSLKHTQCQFEQEPTAGELTVFETRQSPYPHSDILQPVKEWLDAMTIHDPRVARFICKMVPSQCPFERDITLFGRKLVHIPPLCKLNPLYEQLVGLRFRSLSYLADGCHEDVSEYV